ncbi:hypothetical protein [Baekduia soli]|uniref:hypothetical protein n=1 Tax=Baekduia soli TaxID=496014 RepID=UPI0016526454|nr:hypothetical protein [Baekduia soli]
MPPEAMSSGTVMGIFLMAVIVLGWVGIWALWHFVFRAAAAKEPPDPGPGEPPPGG